MRQTRGLRDAAKSKKRAMLRKHNKSSMPAVSAIHNLNESFTRRLAAETQQDFNSSIGKAIVKRNDGLQMRPSFNHDDTTATCEPLSIRNSIENSNYTSVMDGKRHRAQPTYM